MLTRLTNNLTLKIVSLMLAVGLWLVVTAQRREQVTEQAFRLPLIFSSVPETLIVTSDSDELPDAVNVRLRGPESRLVEFGNSSSSVQLDLSGAEPGEIDLAISAQSISVPNAVSVVSIDPPRVTLSLEERMEKAVTIRPFLVGEVADGFLHAESSATPDIGRISGPRSVVEQFEEINTERVVLSGRRVSFTNRVGLVADHPLVQVMEPSNTAVTVVIVPEVVPPEAPETSTEIGENQN